MHYLGIDVGGTTIKGGLVDESGKILATRNVHTIVDDIQGFLSKLTELIRAFQMNAAIDAIGIGVPGLHSSRTHLIKTSPNIPCLKDINLRDIVADQVHTRVITENDANAGAYAELVCGAGVGVQHMAYLTLGTGLGSGLILNGRLFTGASGYAGEFGHTVVDAKGRQCTCGNHGCLETLVSGTGITRTALEKLKGDTESILHGTAGPLTAQMIYEAAMSGDQIANEVFAETGWYLGIACVNLINLLNLEMIVLGGGVMASGDLLLRRAKDVAMNCAFTPSALDCQIVQSKLWPEAGVIGAAMLARDR